MATFKLIFNGLKLVCVAVATVFVGFKWVQNEFRAIAKDVVGPEVQSIQQIRANDMLYITQRFDRIESKIDKILTEDRR